MDIDIRKNILSNFKDSTKEEIKASIESALQENKEITLPGMGVFFELLFQNSEENEREFIVNTLFKSLQNPI